MSKKMSDFANNETSNQKLSEVATNMGRQLLRLSNTNVFNTIPPKTEDPNNKVDRKYKSKSKQEQMENKEQTKTQKTEQISTKEVFTALIKNTFNTFTIGPHKWSVQYQSVEHLKPEYLNGRKTCKAPFNKKTVDYIIELFERALSGQTTYSSASISCVLDDLFLDFFNTDFGYLIIGENESEDIINKKCTHWNILIAKLCTHALNKEFFRDPDLFDNESKDFRKEYFESSEQKAEKPVPETTIPKSADTGNDKGGSDDQGCCIFFLDSPYLDVGAFINEYKRRTIYKEMLEDFPEIDIQFNPVVKDIESIRALLKQKIENRDVLPILETNSCIKGFDMEAADAEMVENKRILLIKGDAMLHKDIRSFFPDIITILLLPYTYREPASEECRYEEASNLLYQNYHDRNRYEAMIHNNEAMNYFIKNRYSNTYVLRWNPNEKEEDYMNNSHFTAYCHGVLDTIISMRQPTFYRKELLCEMNEQIETTMSLLGQEQHV